MSAQQALIDGLQKAYTQAGQEMGLAMAAAVSAIVSEAAQGGGLPVYMAWPAQAAPEALMKVVPENEAAKWIICVAEGIEETPYMEGAVLWQGQLVSGHKVILLS